MTRMSLPLESFNSVTELPAMFATHKWVPSEARAAGLLKR